MFGNKVYSKEQLMTRMRFIIGILLGLTFAGSLFTIIVMMAMGRSFTMENQNFLIPILMSMVSTLAAVVTNSRHDSTSDTETKKDDAKGSET